MALVLEEETPQSRFVEEPTGRFVEETEEPTFFQRAARRFHEAAEQASDGIKALLETAKPPKPGESVIPPAGEGISRGLRVAAGVFSPFMATAGPAIAAPVEHAARGLGASEEVARFAGDISLFAVPLGAAKLAKMGKAELGTGTVATATRALLGIPAPTPPIEARIAAAQRQRPTTMRPKRAVQDQLKEEARPLEAQTPVGRGDVPSTEVTASVETIARANREAGKSTMPNTVLLPELTDPILKQSIHKNTVKAAEEVFTSAGVARDPNRLISDQIMDLLASERISLPEVESILKANGSDFADFARVFRSGVTDAARRMQVLSVLERKIGQIAKDPESRAELTKLLDIAADLDEGVRGSSWWRRADNIRRGLLVSQIATAVRNFETQVGRVGLDVMDKSLQAGLERLFGKPKTHPLDGFESIARIFRSGTKQQVEDILSAFPREKDRLLSTYHSDIAAKARRSGMELKGADKILSAGEDAVAVLNTFNRFQEFLVRRGTFLGELTSDLARQGKNLDEIIALNRVGDIPLESVKKSVDKALEVTWAAQPKYGTLGQKFISFINAMPGATLAIPFPRFMVNSMKFMYEFSPLAVLKVLSKSERQAFAAGNMQSMSRAMLGTAMLGAAYEFRNSEYAGERWYEAKLADGRIIDLRPFNPFAAYLFVGDVAKRLKDGTLHRLESKDIAMGILSANVRAGTGLFIMDQALKGLTDLGDPEKALRALKSFAGETVAGFLTPLQQVFDVMAEYDENLRVIRERRGEPFLGPIKARIPGQAETLPPAYLPTREGPLKRDEPFLRQATGLILTQPKNALERELDRLQFNRQEILPSSGEPEWDNLMAKHMGKIAERRIAPLVETEGFQKRSDAEKGVILRKYLTEARESAGRAARAEKPVLFMKLKQQRRPARLRLFEEERREERSDLLLDAMRSRELSIEQKIQAAQ